MLIHHEEFNGYYGNLKARKCWDRPFTIKKIKENKEVVMWDEVMWFTYVDLSEIKLVEYHVGGEEPTPKRFKV